MKRLDRFLQDWRIAKARPFIANGARLLDIGCADGKLLKRLEGWIGEGLGIEPHLSQNGSDGSVSLISGHFPEDMPVVPPFDVITMLAVLEHFPASQYSMLHDGCARFLKPGGLLIITVPSPRVDVILGLLGRMNLIDGMSLDEHHGYRVDKRKKSFVPPAFNC